MQGANEERTEPYLSTAEGVPELATQQRAKSGAAKAGFARLRRDALRSSGKERDGEADFDHRASAQ